MRAACPGSVVAIDSTEVSSSNGTLVAFGVDAYCYEAVLSVIKQPIALALAEFIPVMQKFFSYQIRGFLVDAYLSSGQLERAVMSGIAIQIAPALIVGPVIRAFQEFVANSQPDELDNMIESFVKHYNTTTNPLLNGLTPIQRRNIFFHQNRGTA